MKKAWAGQRPAPHAEAGHCGRAALRVISRLVWKDARSNYDEMSFPALLILILSVHRWSNYVVGVNLNVCVRACTRALTPRTHKVPKPHHMGQFKRCNVSVNVPTSVRQR